MNKEHVEEKGMTPSLIRILSIAKEIAMRKYQYIGVDHLMAGIMIEGNNFGSITLAEAGFTVDGLMNSRGPIRAEMQRKIDEDYVKRLGYIPFGSYEKWYAERNAFDDSQDKWAEENKPWYKKLFK